MTAARLKELEEMAARLLETARKLPSGQDRDNALQEIERFRARITALQRLDLRSAQSPQPYDLVTRPCTIHAGRFRWDIRQNGRLFNLSWNRSPASRKLTWTVALSSKN